jgi:hypothetical protein
MDVIEQVYKGIEERVRKSLNDGVSGCGPLLKDVDFSAMPPVVLQSHDPTQPAYVPPKLILIMAKHTKSLIRPHVHLSDKLDHLTYSSEKDLYQLRPERALTAASAKQEAEKRQASQSSARRRRFRQYVSESQQSRRLSWKGNPNPTAPPPSVCVRNCDRLAPFRASIDELVEKVDKRNKTTFEEAKAKVRQELAIRQRERRKLRDEAYAPPSPPPAAPAPNVDIFGDLE